MIAQIKKKELKKKSSSRVSADPIRKLKIWVLYPHLETSDPNLQHYYDFKQSLQEYTKVFQELDADWQWQPVTMQNFREIIGSIKRKSGRKVPLVLNLCDGDEVNGTPGISVIHELDQQQLIYTGSNAHYYNITTSKIPMKRPLMRLGCLTPSGISLMGMQEKVFVKNSVRPLFSSQPFQVAAWVYP